MLALKRRDFSSKTGVPDGVKTHPAASTIPAQMPAHCAVDPAVSGAVPPVLFFPLSRRQTDRQVTATLRQLME